MADSNKVKFGLSNVFYAIATLASDGTASYGSPKAIPGAVSLSMPASSNRSVFYADNIEYYVSSGATSREGTLTVAKIPDGFYTDIFSMVTDTEGAMIDNVNSAVVHFALTFEFSGDANKTRHVLYNCTATRPAIGSETTNESVTPVTEEIPLQCSSIWDSVNEIYTDHAKVAYGSSPYATWNEAIYQTAAATTT